MPPSHTLEAVYVWQDGGTLAVSVVLLIASGLLIRAMWRVQAVDPGFSPAAVLTMQTDLPSPRYDDPARLQALPATPTQHDSTYNTLRLYTVDSMTYDFGGGFEMPAGIG